MKLPLTCEVCGLQNDYHHDDVVMGDPSFVICHGCSAYINLPTETIFLGEKLEQQNVLPVVVLEKGDLVRLNNPDHVWYNQIALICGIKLKFYRLEINGKKIWVPQEWVIKDESFDFDERDR
jgi:hypothetical protein